jgi:hypothetical protein
MNKLFLIIIGIILINGCVGGEIPESITQGVKSSCISLCNEELEKGTNLENGPCLSDNTPNWNIENWVCDVAHSPRENVDNLRENQCDDWHNKKASHFVEVYPNCEFIRTI